MNEEEGCNTTLELGIQVEVKREKKLNQTSRRGFWLDLSLPVQPKSEASDHDDHKHDEEINEQDSISSKIIDENENKEEEEDRRTKRSDSSNDDRYHANYSGSRKKLKLTTEQIALLEDSFKIHSTLNTAQKHELAKKLHLLPRQIEVWFQNRRARTKLKQIEQECILLKKYCETLSDENRRLKKELREAGLQPRPTQPPLPFYIRCPTASSTERRQPCYEIEKTDDVDDREQP